jgi:voltage-gated potassium channel
LNAASLADVLRPGAQGGSARAYRAAYHAAVVTGVAAVVAETQAEIAADWGSLVDAAVWLVVALFAVDLALRLGVARRIGPAGAWRSPMTMVDAVAAIGVPAALLAGLAGPEAHLLGLVWLLKLGRYAGGLTTLGRVVRNAAEPLVSVLIGFVIVLMAAATLAYVLEGKAQPEAFGSIPRAMWWAIVTLTTTGYGDVTPHSPLGRLLGGVVMVCGIAVFGLWAGILASGFVDEMRRRDFLRNWDLVAKAPLFRDLGADVIAEIARLLRRREFGAGAVVVRRGDAGSAMYFLMAGEVEVRLKPQPVRLNDGAFFGEMALISGAPRNATVVATRPTLLLELDVADFRALAGRTPPLMEAIYAAARDRGLVTPEAAPD